MLELKACSRCNGDVKLNRDMYGTYKECLQCGRILDIQTELKEPNNWSGQKEKVGSKPQAA